MVNIFDITKCAVPPREKILPGLISDCSIPEMYFPPICSCPDFSISPPLDPPAIPCVVTPENFQNGVRITPPPPPPPPPNECKLAEECCPTSNEVKKLCYDPRKKPDWGKTIQKDKIQYEPKDEDCKEPCGDVLWLKEECPDPCTPEGGGDPCVDDPCGNPPGHPDYDPVIPPSTGTAIDDCCWWMWCPCNIKATSAILTETGAVDPAPLADGLTHGNHGGGHNPNLFPDWPKPYTKSDNCPASSGDISSDTSAPGHWVRITGQGAAVKCGSVKPPGILGRYWGDVAIVCFCKITPGSGLSFKGQDLSLLTIGLSLAAGETISMLFGPVTNLGSALSLATFANCGSLMSLGVMHPIDNEYAQCCVCTHNVTGPGQDELNGTYCKKVLTDTEYLREGNSQIKIEKLGGGWCFTVQGNIVARGKPLTASTPVDVPQQKWKNTPAAANVFGGVHFGECVVVHGKCDGTDSGEYLFNRLSFDDKQIVHVNVGNAMWNRPIQAQTLLDSSSSGTWGSSVQLRADGYYQDTHTATGTPNTAASMTIASDSFNTGGGEWFVVASMYTTPTYHGTAETPYIVHPYLTPFAVMNISAEISAANGGLGGAHGQNLGLLLKQGDKYYGCKIGCAVDSNYSLFILRGLTEESFCEIDIPPASAPAPTDPCSYSIDGDSMYVLSPGASDYPQFYVDVDVTNPLTKGSWSYTGGDVDDVRFTHFGRPLMKPDSHPKFAGTILPIQLGIFVAHQVGLNLCVLKPDTTIRNLTVTVGC